MTDELERLAATLRTATPEPDADAKARALSLAQESFAARQGSPDGERQRGIETRQGGILQGAIQLMTRLTSVPVLASASGVAAIGLAVLVALPEAYRPAATPERSATIGEEAEPADGRGLALEPGIATRTADQPAAGNAAPVRQPPPPTARPKPEAPAPAVTMPPPVAGARPHGMIAPPSPDVAMDDALGGGERSRPAMVAETDGERFAGAPVNPLKVTREEPVSTFSIDVDTASYAFVRSSLMGGYLPPADAVRLEEMVNYFPYDYAAPVAGDEHPFSTEVSVFDTPWNPDTDIVHIAIQGEKPAMDDRPPLDLVFLIDTSGSMEDANKLPLLKQSFRLLLSQLTPQDRVAIVTYAGSSGVVLEPTAADDRAEIVSALDRLAAGGSTAGQAGLVQAYALAEEMHEEGRIGRILLATDGDFNVGISDPEDLKAYVAGKREGGRYLSVLGFGRGNYHDALMQALAQNGNGTAAYIDTLAEARKVLVDQVSGALFPIADDVKIQVEFNPAVVAEYRLIGYETRLLAREDFNNDRIDAGEVGAGHAVTALYEITPVGSPAVRNEPLRYREAEPQAATGVSDEIGFVKLRYKAPGEDTSVLMTTPIVEGGPPSTDANFAASIAWFGQMLGDDRYLVGDDWPDLIALAEANRGKDPFGYRTEAVTLMRLAESLSVE